MIKVLITLIKFLFIIVPVLIGVAYLTLLERKILGYSQRRKGPNVVGFYGILQPLADGVKLFSKEFSIPNHVNIISYTISPIMALMTAFILWVSIPILFNSSIIYVDLSLLLILALSSISVYAILLAGWSSNSKYAFLGSIRAVAQMISYEVSIGLIIITVIIISGSINIIKIIVSQKESISYVFPVLPIGIILFVSCLAETNRAPFDLTEGESELVSGFNVEYASMAFALFFLAEYSHIIFMSMLLTLLFFSGSVIGWLKIIIAGLVVILFIWVRSSYPRVRYDKLMALLWKTYLPLSILFIFISFSLLFIFNSLPPIF
nr:NADH dehydrogenase subunit 1 [Nemalecium lighti]